MLLSTLRQPESVHSNSKQELDSDVQLNEVRQLGATKEQGQTNQVPAHSVGWAGQAGGWWAQQLSLSVALPGSLPTDLALWAQVRYLEDGPGQASGLLLVLAYSGNYATVGCTQCTPVPPPTFSLLLPVPGGTTVGFWPTVEIMQQWAVCSAHLLAPPLPPTFPRSLPCQGYYGELCTLHTCPSPNLPPPPSHARGYKGTAVGGTQHS